MCPLCATDHDGWRTTGCPPRPAYTASVSVVTPEADFHDHLDRCAQCREHPFGLCAEGAALLALGGVRIRSGGAEQERAAIVAWLRAEADEGGARRAALHYAADAVERGEHLGRKP